MKAILITVFLFVCSVSCLAQGPECGYNATPCEAYAKADAIFVAKVTRIRPETIEIWQRDKDYDQVANLSIEKVYKGSKRSTLVLHQLGRKNAPKFILGSRYLFYANFDRATRKWEVRDCSRTIMVAYAQDDLSYLDGLHTSAGKTRIAGMVTRYDTDKENPQGTTERLAGIRIKIIGADKQFEVTTNAKGIYELYGAPAGQYQIQPVIPSGLMLFGVIHYGPLDPSQFRSLRIELKESACSGAGILLTTDPTIGKPKIGLLTDY